MHWRWNCARPAIRAEMRAVLALLAIPLLGGCIAYTVASTAVSVTATVIETTVDVTAGAVSGAADLITGDDDDEESDAEASE